MSNIDGNHKQRALDSSPSYLKLVGEPALVLAVLLGLWGYRAVRERPDWLANLTKSLQEQAPVAPVVSAKIEESPPPTALEPEAEPEADPEPLPEPAAPPKLDRVAVARAEASLQSARRDRGRSQARLEEAKSTLSELTIEQAASALDRRAKLLESTVRDVSTKLAQAKANGARIKAERDALEKQLATLTNIPRPKPRSLVDKSPVATASEGHETFFEVRRDRVAFVNVDRLLDLFKNEMRKKLDGQGLDNGMTGKVGPVGAFAMRYELSRSVGDIDDLVSQRMSLGLRAFEIVPLNDVRGETFETAMRPMSEFSRALHLVSPGRSMITLWVYPDGFTLYRKLRDSLHSRGYLVAARPLPDGIPIRGSTGGSLSAGQ